MIDEDRAFFDKAVIATYDTLDAAEVSTDESTLVVTSIGRNAVGFAAIKVNPTPSASIGVMPRPQFVELFEDHEFELRGGGTATLHDGQIQAGVGGVILRHSNAAGVFGATPEETLALMCAISTSPVQVVAGV